VNPEQMINQLSGRLSLRRRVAIVVAMLGGLTVASVVGLLWATEPALPGRTRVAFGALVVVGLAWAGYGVWVLTRRTPLYALDRVIAAWLALTATSLLAGTVAVVAILRHRAEPVAAGTALGLLVVAVANLVRARARRAALLRRKRELGG
jgi:hypothetical protein